MLKHPYFKAANLDFQSQAVSHTPRTSAVGSAKPAVGAKTVGFLGGKGAEWRGVSADVDVGRVFFCCLLMVLFSTVCL